MPTTITASHVLAALVLNLAPHAAPTTLALIHSALCYDTEIQFYGPEADRAPLIGVFYADGAVEMVVA